MKYRVRECCVPVIAVKMKPIVYVHDIKYFSIEYKHEWSYYLSINSCLFCTQCIFLVCLSVQSTHVSQHSQYIHIHSDSEWRIKWKKMRCDNSKSKSVSKYIMKRVFFSKAKHTYTQYRSWNIVVECKQVPILSFRLLDTFYQFHYYA